jgi:hypothetical protein
MQDVFLHGISTFGADLDPLRCSIFLTSLGKFS